MQARGEGEYLPSHLLLARPPLTHLSLFPGSPGAVDGTHVCLILIQGEVSQPGRPPPLPRAQETPGPFSCGRRRRRRLVTLLSLGPGDPGQSASLSLLCRVLGSPLASFPGCHCAQQRGAMWSGPRPRHCSGGPAPPRPPLPRGCFGGLPHRSSSSGHVSSLGDLLLSLSLDDVCTLPTLESLSAAGVRTPSSCSLFLTGAQHAPPPPLAAGALLPSPSHPSPVASLAFRLQSRSRAWSSDRTVLCSPAHGPSLLAPAPLRGHGPSKPAPLLPAAPGGDPLCPQSPQQPR